LTRVDLEWYLGRFEYDDVEGEVLVVLGNGGFSVWVSQPTYHE
jgi:hypothetical protein